MTVYIDADSCPKAVRDIIYRACDRHSIPCVQAANRHINHPPHVQMMVVDNSEGAADEYLLQQAGSGDMVITRDIPLAARLLENGVSVLNDRGTLFSADSIRERLSIRNVNAQMRSFGILESPDSSWSPSKTKAFADCFNREFMRLFKNR